MANVTGKEDVFDKARTKSQHVQEKARQGVDQAKERLDNARNTMMQAREQVAGYVCQNPMTSLLIAAGVGAVIGSMWTATMNRKQ